MLANPCYRGYTTFNESTLALQIFTILTDILLKKCVDFWPPGGQKMADGVWKGGMYPKVFGPSRQLLLNKFLALLL